jgi:hypothetical protein
LTSQTRELQDLTDNEAEIERKITMKEREQTETEKREALLSGGGNGGRFNSKPSYRDKAS